MVSAAALARRLWRVKGEAGDNATDGAAPSNEETGGDVVCACGVCDDGGVGDGAAALVRKAGANEDCARKVDPRTGPRLPSR